MNYSLTQIFCIFLWLFSVPVVRGQMLDTEFDFTVNKLMFGIELKTKPMKGLTEC
jgi:hypothetical protein